MSWDIRLIGAGPVPRIAEGGTYVLGGSTDPELNITWNYSPHYYKVINKQTGIRWLHNKRAGNTIWALKAAIQKLGTVREVDYWEATEGNAGFALSILLEWAELYPESKWEVS